MERRKTRAIRIDASKCTGCRACEVICSSFHSQDSLSNPRRSRIRILADEYNDQFLPVLAGQYTEAECAGRYKMVIDGKEYDDCSFCRASCPSRDLFKEPDSGIPLKCDMCGEPPQPEPLCVVWCMSDALTYVEGEEEVEQEVQEPDESEIAMDYLIKKFGIENLQDILDRKSGSRK